MGLTSPSISRNTACFTARFSTTASTTTSALVETFIGKAWRDRAHDRIGLVLREPSGLHRLGEQFARFRHAKVERRRRNILHDDRHAARGTLIGDAAAHDSGPRDSRLCYPRRVLGITADGLLHGLLVDENRNKRRSAACVFATLAKVSASSAKAASRPRPEAFSSNSTAKCAAGRCGRAFAACALALARRDAASSLASPRL